MIEMEEAVTKPPPPSPATSSSSNVTGVVYHSLTVVVATPLELMATGKMARWPASPSGVALSWPSEMRALSMVTRVRRKHQQLPEAFAVKIVALDMAVEGKHASILS